jgi:alginate O-acetyltransferase complex protein AlgI
LKGYSFLPFFAVVAAAYFVVPFRYRWVVLLASCYAFAAVFSVWWSIPIMSWIAVVVFVCARLIENEESEDTRRKLLALGIVFSLAPLGVFGYGITLAAPGSQKILGLSFYTLQAIAYLIDVYRRQAACEHNPVFVATYVSFLPTLSAGPIERGKHLLVQLHRENRFEYERVTYGMKLMALGLFKKILIADRLAVFVDQVFGKVSVFHGYPLMLASVLFAFQLYADFSGYTDIVRGFAMILGYDLFENFRQPYFSQSIRDFWRRWHMSLTSWLRDYLYIPLGGNRGSPYRTYLNIMLVFIVCGIWHGPSLTFVVWGALHGFYQIASRVTHDTRVGIYGRLGIATDGRLMTGWRILCTFLLVDFAWIFFRSASMNDALYVIRNMFGPANAGFRISPAHLLTTVIAVVLLVLIDFLDIREPLVERVSRKEYLWRWGVYVSVIVLILVFGMVGSKGFIYAGF